MQSDWLLWICFWINVWKLNYGQNTRLKDSGCNDVSDYVNLFLAFYIEKSYLLKRLGLQVYVFCFFFFLLFFISQLQIILGRGHQSISTILNSNSVKKIKRHPEQVMLWISQVEMEELWMEKKIFLCKLPGAHKNIHTWIVNIKLHACIPYAPSHR